MCLVSLRCPSGDIEWTIGRTGLGGGLGRRCTLVSQCLGVDEIV